MFFKCQQAPVGQIYPQNPSYYMGGAQRFYPPAIQQVRPPNPRWQQAQMRAAGQQPGGKFSTLIYL